MPQLIKKQNPPEAERGDQLSVEEKLRDLLAKIDELKRPDPTVCIELIEGNLRFIYENERWPEDFFAVLRIYQDCWRQLRPTDPVEEPLAVKLKQSGVPAVMARLLRGSDSSISWNADYFKDLALVSEAKADFETALSYVELAAKLDPANAQVCVVRGWILCDLDCEDEAVGWFLRAYELNPQNHAANNALAKHCAAKDPEKALEHINRALEVSPDEGSYTHGNGIVHIIRKDPKEFVLDKSGDKELMEAVETLYNKKTGKNLIFKNNFVLKRGPYDIAAVTDESVSDEPLVLRGSYIDLFDPALPVITEKTVKPGEQAFLYNLKRTDGKRKAQVVASSGRVYDESTGKKLYSFTVKGPVNTTCVMRVLLPKKPVARSITDKEGLSKNSTFEWDDTSKTCLIKFENDPDGIEVHIKWQ